MDLFVDGGDVSGEVADDEASLPGSDLTDVRSTGAVCDTSPSENWQIG